MNARHRYPRRHTAAASALAAAALVGGCGGPPVAGIPTPVVSTTAATTPPPEPVKYTFTDFPTCAEIRQRAPELAPPLTPQRGMSPGRFSQTCEYLTSKDFDGVPTVSFRVELYDNERDSFGFHSGAEQAKRGFFATPQPQAVPDTTLGFGSAAQWAHPGASNSCELKVLDENASLHLHYNAGTRDLPDPRSEECREPARVLARKLYAAIQPR
ncbi:hypothetical protein JOF53_000496 [Crossiella equi]|uniref:DUF3558 domain-containing protein n=1 Tax=Crossiella equi TaxID=130796 RepID=A0ABS5A5Y3_9PSEU|nr:hypothetical protein [Crossiella equi]MBP2471624.1 hypothetical protein [Crossiella equi]